MRVLITGGAGFIGGHLAERLVNAEHEVAVLDDLSSGSRENVPQAARFYQADISDALAVQAAFDDFRPELVSHQAAQMSVSRSVREPDFDARVNVMGLIHTLQAAVRVGVRRFVFASSGGVLYGDVEAPVDEAAPKGPVSPYGISKWAGEQYLEFFSREYHLATVALRYSNVYGPRQNPHGEAGVVAIFCTRLLQGEPATINGDGKYIRDYVYVGDVVAANLQVLTGTSTGFTPYNVGTGRPTDVNELGEALLNCCREELARRNSSTTLPLLQHGPARAGDLRSNLISSARLTAETGWTPAVSLETGLQQTVAWFAEQLLP